MSEKDWWSSYGPFKRWNECPTRPDPGEVLLFYLERCGIGPEEHVAYLIDLFDLQKSTVYNILKGEGLDAISRCRQLVRALKIPPPLLGIDARYYPIERYAYWWQTYGYSFHADAQGYPVISEVIAYLRMQRVQIDEGGKVKAWSQEDLGDATGLKKETIYRMEHDKNPLILESMSRRAIVASALGTLAAENEPTLFRLFGLDPQAHGVPMLAHESVPEVHFLPKRLTDEVLKGFHRRQGALFTEYYTHHGEGAVAEALEWMRQFPTLMPLAGTTAQRVSILALQSRNHRLLLGVAREQGNKESIAFHAHQAVKLAQQAMTLPNPKLRSEHALLVTSNELLAAALLFQAIANYELGQYDLAREYIDQALELSSTLQSGQLKRELLAGTGLVHAHTARGEMDRTLVLSYFNLAAQIPTSSSFQAQPHAPDDNFIRCDNGWLYLRKAMALSAPTMKGATAEKVSDILETAQRITDPELMRRQTIIEVFQALDHFTAGEWQMATEVALLALENSRRIRSRLNRNRIEELYHQLLNTSFRYKPLFSCLGMKLRTWDHRLG